MPSFVAGADNFSFDANDAWKMINEPQKNILVLLSKDKGLAAYTNGCAFEPLYNSGIQYGVS